MYYDTQSAPRPDNGGKTKVWKIIALVLLLLCALPVLIPAALCVGGGVLVMALCVAGAALTAVLCVAGGVICAGLCVLGGLLLSGTAAARRADWNRLRRGIAFSDPCKRPCHSGGKPSDNGSGRSVLDCPVAAGRASVKGFSHSGKLDQTQAVRKTGGGTERKRRADSAGCTGCESWFRVGKFRKGICLKRKRQRRMKKSERYYGSGERSRRR